MKTFRITYLFLICMLFALPLSAQESAMEQFMSAHSMSMLTADSVDPNHHDLVITALAMQQLTMTDQPAHPAAPHPKPSAQSAPQPCILQIDTISGRAELLAMNGRHLADVHFTLVDSTWYMWLSVDPLADKYPGNSPYLYCSGNPVARIDPDGKADYYDIDGNHLCNDGIDDRKVFQQNEQGDIVLGGYATPFSFVGEIDRISMVYDAKMCSQTSRKSVGKLTVSQFVGDKEFQQEFDACSGTNSKYYTLQNGTYSCWNYRERDKKSYIWEGVGFSIELLATFDTKRTLLQIHPDGSEKIPPQHDGTMGCIGLLGTAAQLQQFIRTVTPFIPKTQPASVIVPLKVNVIGNPNCYQASPLKLGCPQ